jgi:hypothetical protein
VAAEWISSGIGSGRQDYSGSLKSGILVLWDEEDVKFFRGKKCNSMHLAATIDKIYHLRYAVGAMLGPARLKMG